jgi:hypothetical protein
MINAMLTIPWFIMTFLLSDKIGIWSKVVETFLQTTSAFIFVFTSLTLKKQLNAVHGFQGVDRYILLLVKANIVLTAVSLIGIAVPSIADSAGVIAIILIVPLGVIQLIFGYRPSKAPLRPWRASTPLLLPEHDYRVFSGCNHTVTDGHPHRSNHRHHAGHNLLSGCCYRQTR